jgi:hypothetical protein
MPDKKSSSVEDKDTVQVDPVTLPADPVENPVHITMKQIEFTVFRFASIGVGLAWYHNASFYEAGLMASNACSVLLLHLGVPNDDKSQKLIHEAVKNGLFNYYKNSGVPCDTPRGNPEVKFVKNKQ